MERGSGAISQLPRDEHLEPSNEGAVMRSRLAASGQIIGNKADDASRHRPLMNRLPRHFRKLLQAEQSAGAAAVVAQWHVPGRLAGSDRRSYRATARSSGAEVGQRAPALPGT